MAPNCANKLIVWNMAYFMDTVDKEQQTSQCECSFVACNFSMLKDISCELSLKTKQIKTKTKKSPKTYQPCKNHTFSFVSIFDKIMRTN